MAAADSVYKFWNSNPCNIRHSCKEIGSKEYFDEVEAKKYKVEPHIPGFADFARWKGKKVLEIGCGIGTAAVGFARAGADYTGVDLTDSAVSLARKRFANEGLVGNFYVMDAEKGLPSGRYDLVYSFGVIHHTPNPSNVISNIINVIADDGELRMMLYSKWSYKLFWMLRTYDDAEWSFGKKTDETIMKYSEAQTGCPVTYTYTFGGVKKLLGDRFAVSKIWKDHIFPYEVEPYKRGEYVIVPEFRDMDGDSFASMCAELGWHTMVIARPTKVS